MIKKRFKLAFENFDGWAICDTTGEYSDDEDYIDWLSGQKAVDVLNHFADENEQLKIKLENVEDARKSYKEDWKACTAYCDGYKNEIHDLKDNINGLLEENEQLKQFKQNVFGLIDKNLEKDKHGYEMTYEDYLNGRIEVLEELKKELKE